MRILKIIFAVLLFGTSVLAQTTGKITAAAKPGNKSQQCVYAVQIGDKTYTGLNRGLHGSCDDSLVGKEYPATVDGKQVVIVLPERKMKLEVLAVSFLILSVHQGGAPFAVAIGAVAVIAYLVRTRP